ncbi:hypothetical protein DPMN_186692 [Dreissena polymorpha]|uniref:Uncharacterized protein n=3 Tax=Dreissena polymorpha TaxID=45954 RepID=A0A9D4I9T2_DREPO|nr:hypothetical protein DPMN_186692 [Dreissena polymorpha]
MADNNERRKMKELLREKEKGDVPLQWMYKESKPDAEDFLLGKRIDKIGESEDIKQDQFALILEERTKHIIEMDTKAKMREDPLFAIRKQEEDAKRKLLENPVKMKRLQKALERQNKSEHKKSKKKKHKKGKSDSDGSDDDLMSAYLNILKSKQKGGDMEGKYVQKTKEKGVNNAREVSPVARERTGQRVNTQQVGREEKRQMDSYSEQRPEGKQKRRHSSSESDNDAESDNRRMNRIKGRCTEVRER